MVLLHYYLESIGEWGRNSPICLAQPDAPLPYGPNRMASNGLYPTIWLLNPRMLRIRRPRPPMEIETSKRTAEIATGVEISVCKRAYGSAILLLKYASLLFPDAQRLRRLDVKDDSVHGPLIASRAVNPHGRNWYPNRPREHYGLGPTGVGNAYVIQEGRRARYVVRISAHWSQLGAFGYRPRAVWCRS